MGFESLPGSPRAVGCTLVAFRSSGHTPTPDGVIAALAARQHGLVTVAQLLAAGLDRSAIARRVAEGRVGVRLHRTRALHTRDVTTHKGIPVTTIVRTLVDLTDLLTPHTVATT